MPLEALYGRHGFPLGVPLRVRVPSISAWLIDLSMIRRASPVVTIRVLLAVSPLGF